MSRLFRLAQLSDPHVSDRPRADGRDPPATLARALDAAGRAGADAILITGDLVDRGSASEYSVLRDVLAAAPAPIYLLPGNHDDPATLRACFPEHAYLPRAGRRLSWVVEDWPVRLVALDAHLPGAHGGRLEPADEAWLAAALAADPVKPTILAVHHPPFPTLDAGFDEIGLAGAERLAAILAGHPQVERVVCGHYHRAALARFGGTAAVIAPSTAFPFKLDLEGGAPAKEAGPIGFALHAHRPEAGLTTHFVWC